MLEKEVRLKVYHHSGVSSRETYVLRDGLLVFLKRFLRSPFLALALLSLSPLISSTAIPLFNRSSLFALGSFSVRVKSFNFSVAPPAMLKNFLLVEYSSRFDAIPREHLIAIENIFWKQRDKVAYRL